MKNIKLILEYDGTNYIGWQKQSYETLYKDMHSVQWIVDKALNDILNEEVETIGCSRTDTRVHAKGYVLNFYTNTTIPGEKIKYALNNRLPCDIVAISSEEVREDFHSRYSALGKIYEYRILNREIPTAIERNYVYQFGKPLNEDLMNDACKYLIGKHDFSAFKNIGSSVKTSTRTIYELRVQREGDYITIHIGGDGFLYNMVRTIVGTLLRVGRGKIEPKQIIEILESKDRRRAGATVPPQGLTLIEVKF